MAYGLGPEGSELPFSQVLADNDEAHLAGFLLFILYFLFVSFLNGIGLGPEGSELPFSQVLADNDEAHLARCSVSFPFLLFFSFEILFESSLQACEATSSFSSFLSWFLHL